jgi:hypothetical protein
MRESCTIAEGYVKLVAKPELCRDGTIREVFDSGLPQKVTCQEERNAYVATIRAARG